MSKTDRAVLICDYPPSSLAGGPILLRRLFGGNDALTAVIAGSYFLRVSDAASLLPVRHLSVPMLPPGGRPASKIIKSLLRPFFLAVASIRTAALMFGRRREVAMTVAHGSLFVVVLALSRIWNQRTILFVHDDWHGALAGNQNSFWTRLFAWVLRRADRVITVSRQFQSRLRTDFSTESSVLLPARELPATVALRIHDAAQFTLTYLGSLNSCVQDAIEFVASVVKSGAAEKAVGGPVCFRLYTTVPDHVIQEWGLHDRRIEVLPWVALERVDSILSEADALLLPFSFRAENQTTVTTSFPSKTADYLASGVPIVVLAPPKSTTAEYARETGAALLVDRLDEQRFSAALAAISAKTERVRDLSTRAASVLRANHDIAAQRRAITSMIRDLSLVRG